MTLQPIDLGTLPPYIDSSMMVAFRSCPRKFYYEYIQCLRPRGRKVDLVAGGAFAAGLEAAYVARFAYGRSEHEAYQAAYRAFASSWGDFDDVEGHTKSFARTFQAVLDYFTIYPFDTDHVRPMLRHDGHPSFEFSFAVPLTDDRFPRHPDGGPFLFTGRFDAFGHLDGRLVIRDEKTSGRAPSRRWSDQWNLRNQFMLYCWAAQQSGYPVDTVVVRGITIQKTQFHHVEAIKIYPNFLVERAVDQLARDLHRLVDCYRSNYFDFNFGDTCNAYGSPCAFTDPCSTFDPTVWFTDYDRERWNPLLRTAEPVVKEAA